MHDRKTLAQELGAGALNSRIEEVYGCTGQETKDYAERLVRVTEGFDSTFPENDTEELGLYSAPGRTEIGGNHTDHQCGCVLAASVSLDLMAAAAPNGTSSVVLKSEGYDVLRIDIADETVHPEEVNQTASLIRGIAAAIRQRGYQPQGFNACVISDVPGGSGLSSSAAFETLIGVIFNHMFCADSLNPVEIAKIGQYAENVYFGKFRENKLVLFTSSQNRFTVQCTLQICGKWVKSYENRIKTYFGDRL